MSLSKSMIVHSYPGRRDSVGCVYTYATQDIQARLSIVGHSWHQEFSYE
jgi:hypothetical protein